MVEEGVTSIDSERCHEALLAELMKACRIKTLILLWLTYINFDRRVQKKVLL